MLCTRSYETRVHRSMVNSAPRVQTIDEVVNVHISCPGQGNVRSTRGALSTVERRAFGYRPARPLTVLLFVCLVPRMFPTRFSFSFLFIYLFCLERHGGRMATPIITLSRLHHGRYDFLPHLPSASMHFSLGSRGFVGAARLLFISV